MYSKCDFTEKLTTNNNHIFYSSLDTLMHDYRPIESRFEDVDLLFSIMKRVILKSKLDCTNRISIIPFIKFDLKIYLQSEFDDPYVESMLYEGRYSYEDVIVKNNIKYSYIMEFNWGSSNNHYTYNYMISDMEIPEIPSKNYIKLYNSLSNIMTDNIIHHH